VFEVDLHQHPLGRIQRGVPEFFTVHFAEALESGDRQAALAQMTSFGRQVAQMGEYAADIAVFQNEARRRFATGDARRSHQAGPIQAELPQPLQAAIDAADFVEFLNEKRGSRTVTVAVAGGMLCRLARGNEWSPQSLLLRL